MQACVPKWNSGYTSQRTKACRISGLGVVSHSSPPESTFPVLKRAFILPA